jgi:hypothetical protein
LLKVELSTKNQSIRTNKCMLSVDVMLIDQTSRFLSNNIDILYIMNIANVVSSTPRHENNYL